MSPTDQRLGPEDLAGAHVEFRKVVQYQRAVIAVDDPFEVQLDIVADGVLLGHLRVEGYNRISADAFGRDDSLIGATQYVRGSVPAGFGHADTNTHCAGDGLAVDLHLLVNALLQLSGQCLGRLGAQRLFRHDDELVTAETGDDRGIVSGVAQELREYFDEPVAGLVAEVIVDRLEAIQVDKHQRDWTGPARSKALVETRDQRPAVQQPGEVVMLGLVLKSLFGLDARLHLREQCSDRLERVQFLRQPFAVTDLDETQRACCETPGEQRHACDGAVGNTRARLDIALIFLVRRGGPEDVGHFEVFGLREDRVGVSEIHHSDRIGIGNEGSRRPQRDEHRCVDRMIVVTQETEVHAELAHRIGDYLLADRGVVRRGGRHQLGGRLGDQIV